jgi:hypothetical protein
MPELEELAEMMEAEELEAPQPPKQSRPSKRQVQTVVGAVTRTVEQATRLEKETDASWWVLGVPIIVTGVEAFGQITVQEQHQGLQRLRRILASLTAAYLLSIINLFSPNLAKAFAQLFLLVYFLYVIQDYQRLFSPAIAWSKAEPSW